MPTNSNERRHGPLLTRHFKCRNSVAIIEAALSSCALVLSDIPTLRELWHDAAVFITTRDSDAWHTALAELIVTPMRLFKLAQAARERAAHYSSSRMGDAYFVLYRPLLLGAAWRRRVIGYEEIIHEWLEPISRLLLPMKVS